MSDTRAKELIRRHKDLVTKRSTWNSLWEDLARVMLPRRTGFTTQFIEGDRRTDDIFDGAGMRAARGLANAIGGMMRPPGFVKIKVADQREESDEGNFWIDDTQKRLMAGLDSPKARFRQATGEGDLDLSVFGTAVLFIGEGKKLNHLLFQSVHLKDAVAFFDDDGTAAGLFRSKRLKVRQARAMFGENSLGPKAKQLIRDNKLDEELDYLHAVVPRPEGRSDAMINRNLPVASIWIECESEIEVEVGGFHEFPFVVPRWDTSSGEDYGRSPGMIALPDANSLQAIGETMLVMGQRIADPPLFAPYDGTFSEANTFPGGMSYYDVDAARALGSNPVFALETKGNLPLTREIQQDVREGVFQAFFRNILNLPTEGPQMTATEIIQRKEEFIREIGPVFGRLESDYTAPMIERSFKIMLRAGAFLPIPLSLAGKNIRFEYESPVKKIRQQIEAAAARVWVTEMINLAAVKPEAIDLVNVDEYGRHQAESASIPAKVVVGREEVKAIRQQRAKQQAAAAQAQALFGAAEAAGKAAPMVQALNTRRAAVQ